MIFKVHTSLPSPRVYQRKMRPGLPLHTGSFQVRGFESSFVRNQEKNQGGLHLLAEYLDMEVTWKSCKFLLFHFFEIKVSGFIFFSSDFFLK